MKHEDIIERIKTARYVSETYQQLSWQGTVDLLESAMASDVHTDITDDRIVELAVEYAAAANAAGYELYQPERVLRRYLELTRAFIA
jgi:hypothetical protein